jgi:hypothetical protein
MSVRRRVIGYVVLPDGKTIVPLLRCKLVAPRSEGVWDLPAVVDWQSQVNGLQGFQLDDLVAKVDVRNKRVTINRRK